MMFVTTYYSHIYVLWQELHRHEPLHTCSCCFAYDSGDHDPKRREDCKVHQFLLGIYSPFYAQTRATILSLEILPSLDCVYQMVIKHERVRLATQPTSSQPS